MKGNDCNGEGVMCCEKIIGILGVLLLRMRGLKNETAGDGYKTGTACVVLFDDEGN